MEDEDDEFISYGTPLPEYEDETVLKKKAAKELQVRDEKGRQRFHGAFTGGFSAGYFNSVGTKEGWAPSSFVSSRTKIADRLQQNPEDYMDDEDFGEFGIATRKIHTSSNFQDPEGSSIRKRKFVENDNVIPGEAPLKDLVKPISDSIGIKILKKLGWRPGQGIGPRIKKQTAAHKIYGCSPFPDALPLEEDDPTMLSFTFAPEDTDEIFYRPKDNYFGLGYTGLSKHSVLTLDTDAFAPTTTKSWLAKDKKKISISGQAFGVGAYEDEDEDIYTKDDMSQYDFSELLPREKSDTLNRSKKKLQFENSVLEGFHLASNPTSVKKYYPPPELPPNYKPISKLLLRNYALDPGQAKSRHTLSSMERSFILGERKFQSFQLNSGKKNVDKVLENQKQENIPSLNKNTPSFRPFPNDGDKQHRYESYLQLQKIGEIEKLVQPPHMTEWEKQQEQEEFARAAVLFKPLSKALSSRFESRSHLSVEHEVMSAIEKMKEEKKEKVPLKKSLVGSHNRNSVDWFPASLLCKRFNVPNPFPNSSATGVPNVQKGVQLFDHITFDNRTTEESDSATVSSLLSASNSAAVEISEVIDVASKDTSSVNLEIKNNVENVTLENKRPPMDLFKDIFENSSSEDENSSIKEDKAEEITSSNLDSESKMSKAVVCDASSNMPSNQEKKALTTKTGFGVFANLDLDLLNQRTITSNNVVRSNVEPETEVQTKTTLLLKESDSMNSSTKIDLYGPELPPNYSNSPCHASFSDKTLLSKHVKHKTKHKHKHKHKHHKSHKRKKKSSKNDSEASNSSDDNGDVDVLIIKSLKKLQKKRI